MSKKREPVKISSLVGQQQIVPQEIEQAAKQVHHKKEEDNEQVVVKKEQKPKNTRQDDATNVSVMTPNSLYLVAKNAAMSEKIKAMNRFYIHCVKYYLREQGYMK